MFKYQMRLNSPSAAGEGLSGFILRDLMSALTEGIVRALRLRIEGRSTVRGMIPHWLDIAANIEVLLKEPSLIEIKAPALLEALPDRFCQQHFFTHLDSSQSSFAVFQESLREALAGNSNSDLFDNGVLEAISNFASVLQRGVENIEITNGIPRPDNQTIIRSEGLEVVNTLRRQTPPNRRVRIAGTIDTIRHSDKMFMMILESGVSVRGVAANIEVGRLAHFFGRPAIVSGDAVFRPSGSLLRIEADHILEADETASIWSVEPKPLASDFNVRALVRHQGSASGVSAIFGQWPGDETEDELLYELEAVS